MPPLTVTPLSYAASEELTVSRRELALGPRSGQALVLAFEEDDDEDEDGMLLEDRPVSPLEKIVEVDEEEFEDDDDLAEVFSTPISNVGSLPTLLAEDDRGSARSGSSSGIE